MKFFIFFFPASSPGEHIEMTPMIPNTTNQDHDAVKSMDNIVADSDDKNLTVKISEPLVKSETASDNEDNCATNMCAETIQGNVESCRQLKSVDWALLNRRHLKPPKTTTAKP